MSHFPLALLFATLAPAASAQFGPLTSIHSTSTRTRAVTADVDGDGVLDLLTLESLAFAPQFRLSWFQGAGGLPFGPEQSIATLDGQLSQISGGGRAADCGDLNGDGFSDLVVATPTGIVRLDGGPGGQFSAPVTIDPAPCSHAQLIDLDLDGDLDVIRGAFSGATTPEPVLYINNGQGSLRPLTLPGACCTYRIPLVTDVDLDGDLDIVLSTGSGTRYQYFESLGGAVFASGVDIAGLDGFAFVALGDVDSDGDDDLLYAHFVNLPGGWVENVAGSYTTNHVVTFTTGSVSAPRVSDVDGDGDHDLIFVQDLFGTSWFVNNGNNQFNQQVLIDAPRTDATVVDLVDLDGDQANDILFTSALPHGVYAYLNLATLGTDICAANANSTGGPATLRASGTRSVGANQFTLTLQDAPPGQLAAFLLGRTTQLSTLPGSAGVLCLGAPFGIFRGPGQIRPVDAGGTLLLAIDLGSIPPVGGVQTIQSGETWLFQSLFRDSTPLGSSNLSPAIEVTFVP